MSTETFRNERKFTFNASDLSMIHFYVKNSLGFFREVYHPRYINSIYFDDSLFSSLQESFDGTRNRIKYRVRWYGDLLGEIQKPILELKIKCGEAGRKEKYIISPFNMTKHTSGQQISKNTSDNILPSLLKLQIKRLTPVILVRYLRHYYRSRDNNSIFTIDQKITNHKVSFISNNFDHGFINKNLIVLELKYNANYDQAAKMTISDLPFCLTKNSKYANGMQIFY